MREDWVECTFEDVIENISTSNYKIKQKDYISDGEIPVVDQGQELIGGYFNNKENIIPVELPVVVFGDHTKCVKYINFHFVPGADGTKVLKVDDNISTKYIYYLLKVLVFKIEDKGYARHFQFLQKELIPLPPLPEQRAIVKKIEALFSSLDAGIADLKKAQDQLKIYRQAVLKKAFEGELTKEWREKNNLKFDWEETVSGKVMSDINSGSTPKSQYLSSGSGEIQFLKVYNLNFDGSINLLKEPAFIPKEIHLNQNKRAITKSGDVLINIVGPPLGKVSMIPLTDNKEYNINQAIVRFRPNDKISPRFLSWFLQNPITINWLEGTSKATAGQYNVKVTTCREIPMLLPSLEEQAQIVKEIEALLSVCDTVEQQIKDSLTQAEALRQSILKKAFEGKLLTEEEIKACQQAPDYEPAAVLLEKIKAEKVASRASATTRASKGTKRK